MTACIKTFAAIKEISATPLPGEWSTFKAELVESESFGKTGELAKLQIAENYKNVQLMSIENIRCEGSGSLFENKTNQRKLRGVTAFDELLTRRMTKQGSMIFTSLDFSGQIKESLGDRFPEIINSDKTELILMLSCPEASAFLTGVKSRILKFQEIRNQISGNKNIKISDRCSEDEALTGYKESLYFLDLFDTIPEKNGYVPTDDMKMKDQTYPEKYKNIKEEYERDKKSNGCQYQNEVKRELHRTTMSCKEFSSKLTEREAIEIGEMMSLACSPEKIDIEIREAQKLRSIMAGESKS